ncbi:MAG: HTH-type transcriptional regulator CymR [Firmicutes bacterium]|nr:HTH-type transcriptional regulator CymR [Bacillota bacterium]MBT9152999.1 HTH-type transcriptional regulator CymR [Bacillota bacterium]MBT9158178.1 HTH-type transcriptional regulator CymR [Bacillota bacterium]
MRITAKGRYALLAMLDLSLVAVGPVSLGSIAERQNIPQNYLEQVFAGLRKAGLVAGVKGAQGGYTLARPASQITAGQVLRVVEGEFWPVGEVMASEDGVGAAVVLHELVFEPMRACMNDLLDGLSLGFLAGEFSKRQKGIGAMYYI